MLKLNATEQKDRKTTIVVEGWIAKQHSELLEAECRERLEKGQTIRLDLSSVTNVDDGGARTLSRLLDAGVTLIGCSPFLLEFVNRKSET